MELIVDPKDAGLLTKCEGVVVPPLPSDITLMKKVMRANRGVGLSANQVGIDQAFFIAEFSFGFRVCMNPRMKSHGTEIIGKLEGCLSILNDKGLPIYKPKPRWAVIDVIYDAFDSAFNPIEEKRTLKRQDARIFQHEMDHLEGRLCQGSSE